MVKKAKKDDITVIAEVQMWDVDTIQELIDDISDNMAKEDAQYFIKYVDSEPVGFAECQLRYDYVEGTDSSPVGYLEGIFVKEEFRHRGFAKERDGVSFAHPRNKTLLRNYHRKKESFIFV